MFRVSHVKIVVWRSACPQKIHTFSKKAKIRDVLRKNENGIQKRNVIYDRGSQGPAPPPDPYGMVPPWHPEIGISPETS